MKQVKCLLCNKPVDVNSDRVPEHRIGVRKDSVRCDASGQLFTGKEELHTHFYIHEPSPYLINQEVS